MVNLFLYFILYHPTLDNQLFPPTFSFFLCFYLPLISLFSLSSAAVDRSRGISNNPFFGIYWSHRRTHRQCFGWRCWEFPCRWFVHFFYLLLSYVIFQSIILPLSIFASLSFSLFLLDLFQFFSSPYFCSLL